MVRVWQLVVCGLVWIICLSSTGICVLGIYLYVKYIHLEKVRLLGCGPGYKRL